MAHASPMRDCHLREHSCQMAIARFLDRMCWPLGFLDYGSATLRCKIWSLPFLGSRPQALHPGQWIAATSSSPHVWQRSVAYTVFDTKMLLATYILTFSPDVQEVPISIPASVVGQPNKSKLNEKIEHGQLNKRSIELHITEHTAIEKNVLNSWTFDKISITLG